MNEIEQWIIKARQVEIHKAGDASGLIDWYNNGADGQINWGSEGDFDACVAIAGKYIDNPEGFCQLRHIDATGEPSGHAAGEVSKADDSHTPPKGVQEAAQKALDWLKDGKAGDGFTSVGRKRASDLANGHAVSMDTLKRMKAYFDRHQGDKDSPHWDEPSPGKVAWYAWGGDAGYSWAKSVVGSEIAKGGPGSGDLQDHPFRGNQWTTGQGGFNARGGRGGRGGKDKTSSSLKPRMELPSDQKGRAKLLARGLYERAIKNEPEITREINETCQQFGGERIKPEFVLKREENIAEKLVRDAHEYLDTKVGQVEDAAVDLADTVRYTILFKNDENFASTVQKALDDFKNEGFEAVKIKNFYNNEPGNAYRGINCQFRQSTTNQLFEVQFHTPESLALIGPMHKQYEDVRKLDKTSDEYSAGMQDMANKWASVPLPPGIESVGTRSVKR